MDSPDPNKDAANTWDTFILILSIIGALFGVAILCILAYVYW
jgi:hypothetical protein